MSDEDNKSEIEDLEEAAKAPKKSKARRPKDMVDEPNSSDDQLWLVSYADLMTLIACFFILLIAFANFDPQTFSRKAKVFSDAFSGKLKTNPNEMQEMMNEIIEEEELKEVVEVKQIREGLEINLKMEAFFDLGKARIKEDAYSKIDALVDKIAEQGNNYRIMVEGHTDPLPIATSIFPSNWELSSARAGAVIRVFEEKGFERPNLVSIGLADSRPILENKDTKGEWIPENMAKNRRVVVRVLYPASKGMPLGLGVYFKYAEDDGNQPVNALDPPKSPKAK